MGLHMTPDLGKRLISPLAVAVSPMYPSSNICFVRWLLHNIDTCKIWTTP